MSFKNLKIKTKILIGFGIVLILLAVVSWEFFSTLRSTTAGYEEVLTADTRMAMLSANINNQMLLARRSEKDFIMRNDLKYAALVDTAVSNLQDEANTLLALEQKSGHQKDIDNVQSILDNSEIYHKAFQGLVTATIEKGLDENSGLQSNFRNAAHQIEAVLQDVNNSKMEVTLLQIRRGEKDYMLRDNKKYYEKALGYLVDLQTSVGRSGLSTEKKNEIKAEIANYSSAFEALVAKNDNIASLTSEMRTAIHKLEPILEEHYSTARAEMADETAQTSDNAKKDAITPIIVSVVAIGIGLFFAFFISGNISKPLKYIADVSRRIAAGDLDQVIEIDTKDEIGMLASSLNEMLDNMKIQIQYLMNIPTPVMVVDREMGITFINKAGAEAGGTALKNCIGKKCYELFTNPHCQTSDCQTARAMREDGIFTGETIVTARNMNLPIMYTGAPIKNKQGQIIGGLEYVANITQIKKIQNYQENEVKKISGLLQKMAQGDLTVDYNAAQADDDTRHVQEAFSNIAEGLKATLHSLNDILSQVAVASEQIATGSQQVSDSSQSLSQGATEQASSLEEVTASMTEMGSQTKQNADNATQANQLTATARENAERGNEQMQQMLGAMGEINESSGQISKIIKVIDEIAFQTNLLALNAAVEAARAGVHGKGFAVVAEEVRNLAQRSAKAAKETTELIEGSVKKAENGSNIANATANALEEIMAGITKVTDLVGEIASASNEQAQGIGQISEALGQIDQVTQTNTANAEESASASEELSGQAAHLKQMVGRFRLKSSGKIGSWKRSAEIERITPEIDTQQISDSNWEAEPQTAGGNGFEEDFGKF